MSASGSRRRFRVDTLEADGDGMLDPGADVQRHLRVLRVDVGAAVYLFDGRGREVRAEVATVDDEAIRLRVLEAVQRRVESPLDSCLVQAVPVRVARMETVVQQTTELGVRRIVPLLAQRSPQAKAKPAAQRRRAERWRRIADSAAEQCGRTRVPQIDDPRPFMELEWDSLPRPLLIADPAVGEAAFAGRDAGADAPPQAGQGVTVMVGPEGGWTNAEVQAATERGARPLSLGPRVLRADSAGVVALTLLQYLRGDLRGASE